MQLTVLPNLSLEQGQARLRSLAGRHKHEDPAAERARLKSAAQEFEGMMLELMVKEMRKTVPESPLFGRDTGREIFKDMLDSQYVRLMVQRGGVGLTDLMMQQLGRQQG